MKILLAGHAAAPYRQPSPCSGCEWLVGRRRSAGDVAPKGDNTTIAQANNRPCGTAAKFRGPIWYRWRFFPWLLIPQDIHRIREPGAAGTAFSESERMLTQINGFFDIVEQMRAVDTTGLEPLAHPVASHQDIALRLRDDVVSEPDQPRRNQQSAPAVERRAVPRAEGDRMSAAGPLNCPLRGHSTEVTCLAGG